MSGAQLGVWQDGCVLVSWLQKKTTTSVGFEEGTPVPTRAQHHTACHTLTLTHVSIATRSIKNSGAAAAAAAAAAVARHVKQLAAVTHLAHVPPVMLCNRCYLQALLKNARANSSRKGSIAELVPDTDIGVGARGLLNRWAETLAHKTFAQAYAEGTGCSNAAVAA